MERYRRGWERTEKSHSCLWPTLSVNCESSHEDSSARCPPPLAAAPGVGEPQGRAFPPDSGILGSGVQSELSRWRELSLKK